MLKEQKLLRQQMELLAEQSEGALDSDLAMLSNAMCNAYRLLIVDSLRLAALSFVLPNLLVRVYVHIQKTFRSHI